MHWHLFVYCLLPIGLTSLILVSLPIGKYLNSKLVLVGSLRIPYMKINIIQFLIGISIITFTLTTYTVNKHSKTQETNWNGVGLNPTCIRWRAERNFWICTTNIIIYWATYIIYKIKKPLYEERSAERSHGVTAERSHGVTTDETEERKKIKTPEQQEQFWNDINAGFFGWELTESHPCYKTFLLWKEMKKEEESKEETPPNGRHPVTPGGSFRSGSPNGSPKDVRGREGLTNRRAEIQRVLSATIKNIDDLALKEVDSEAKKNN